MLLRYCSQGRRRLTNILRHVRSQSTQYVDSEIVISVSKQRCLIDEPVTVEVSGLPSSETVTIMATTREQGSGSANVFWSHGTFKANKAGRINLGTDAPIYGSYKGTCIYVYVYQNKSIVGKFKKVHSTFFRN